MTCSLGCTSRDCTLGDNGALYKTPELKIALAMQMLVMHREENHHQQQRPVQVVESNSQNRNAEIVSRLT